MLHHIAAHSLGVNVSFKIVRVALEIAPRKHLMIGIGHFIGPDSAVHIVLIGTIVAGLSLEHVIGKYEVVVDHVIPGHSCGSFVWRFAVTIVV